MLTKIIGAMLLTYFVSRALRMVPLPYRGIPRLVTVHAVSFALIGLVVFALRYPLAIFQFNQLQIYVIPQLVWFAMDYIRREQERAAA